MTRLGVRRPLIEGAMRTYMPLNGGSHEVLVMSTDIPNAPGKVAIKIDPCRVVHVDATRVV